MHDQGYGLHFSWQSTRKTTNPILSLPFCKWRQFFSSPSFHHQWQPSTVNLFKALNHVSYLAHQTSNLAINIPHLPEYRRSIWCVRIRGGSRQEPFFDSLMIDSTSIHVGTATRPVENTKTSLDAPEALLLSTRLGFLSHEHLVSVIIAELMSTLYILWLYDLMLCGIDTYASMRINC